MSWLLSIVPLLPGLIEHPPAWGHHTIYPSVRQVQGYIQASLVFRQKTFIRLNTLPGKLSSWVLVTDGLPGDLLPGVLTLQQLRELSYA